MAVSAATGLLGQLGCVGITPRAGATEKQITGELFSENYRFSLLTRITLKDREDIHDGQDTKVPSMGRMQKHKTNLLQIIIFRLQRAAGPYRWVTGVVLSVNLTCLLLLRWQPRR